MDVRGKKLTMSQRKLLMINGINKDEIYDYLLKKIKRNDHNQEVYHLIHFDNGELKEVAIRN
jgi:hypothetical protein